MSFLDFFYFLLVFVHDLTMKSGKHFAGKSFLPLFFASPPFPFSSRLRQKKTQAIYSKGIQSISFLAGKPIHQLFWLVDCILMLIQRVKYIFLFPFHRFVIQFIQFWPPILFIYAPASIHALMYFLLCCFTVMQCQLTLFNVGYLKGLEGQSVYTLHCYSLRPAGSTEKKPCEKKSSTMDTEEVHNANSFPNTTDCFHHNEGKQPLLLSSTSTNNTLTKPPNPRFVPRQNLLDRLNAPRAGKVLSAFFPLFPKEEFNIKRPKERERNCH